MMRPCAHTCSRISALLACRCSSSVLATTTHTHPDDDDMTQSSCPCRPATQSASASDAMLLGLLGLLGSGSGSSTAGITCGLAALVDIIVRWPTGPGALRAGTYNCRGTGAGATGNRGAWCRGKEARGNTSPARQREGAALAGAMQAAAARTTRRRRRRRR
eukprot:COSAG01_NODE_4792_length_4740_cov_8.902392_8_plen_160_part_01